MILEAGLILLRARISYSTTREKKVDYSMDEGRTFFEWMKGFIFLYRRVFYSTISDKGFTILRMKTQHPTMTGKKNLLFYTRG